MRATWRDLSPHRWRCAASGAAGCGRRVCRAKAARLPAIRGSVRHVRCGADESQARAPRTTRQAAAARLRDLAWRATQAPIAHRYHRHRAQRRWRQRRRRASTSAVSRALIPPQRARRRLQSQTTPSEIRS